MIADVLLDAVLDSLKVLPFLFLAHVLIEVFEYKAGSKWSVNKLLDGSAAPLLGGAVGLIPQCGFSVVATKLYSKRNIKLGTLIAVYIATSDEAIPILLATPNSIFKLLTLLSIKFVFALAAGYGINFFLRKHETAAIMPQEAEELCHGCHGHEIGSHEGSQKLDVDNNSNQPPKKFDYSRFIFHPIIHSLTILGFIFIVNLALGFTIAFIGEDKLISAMDSVKYLQPILAGLVGLIPNCAGSVVITQLYAQGGLSLGAAVAGLSVNAGIAYAVLFKENKNLKQNLLIVGGLYAASVLLGIIISIF